MTQLGEMGDDRAVPTLVKVLLNTNNSCDHHFITAGVALGQCGPRGLDALAAAVRLAAVVGLGGSTDRRAQALLDQTESDPDPRVRERARIRMEGFPGK